MLDGHFVWLWINSGENVTLRRVSDIVQKENPLYINRDIKGIDQNDIKGVPFLRRNSHRDLFKGDIFETYNLLKNDKFLLFNRHENTDHSKFQSQVGVPSTVIRLDKFSGDESAELPEGLLSLKPLTLKIDRHFVKGAVKLMVETLRNVFTKSPHWLARSFQSSPSCWKPPSLDEQHFSHLFGR